MNGKGWFDVKRDDGTIKSVLRLEQYSIHWENKIRAEHGLPLRTHYQPGYEQSRVLINGVESKYFNNYNYINNVIRPSYTRPLRGF